MGSGNGAGIRECTLGLSVVLLAAFCGAARAEMYGFTAISNNSGVSGTIATQLSVEVTDYMGDPGRVLLKFSNDILSPYGGNIKGIFFDDRGGLGSISELIEPSAFTVDFTHPASGNANFPEGNNLTPSFETTDWTVFNGGNNKIDPGEYLGVVYDLTAGNTLADVVNAINLGFGAGVPGSLRIGLHVGSIVPLLGISDSDSFVVTPVPAPAAVLLGSLGFSSAAFWLRRRRDLADS